MGQILAIVSSKGGVGKTTTAVNLAAAFASLDFPTLLVEADPQCGIVANFGFDRFDIPRGLAEVARREARADEVTFETSVEGLHVVSSNVWSQAEEAEYLRALELDPLVFREQLASVADAYDYVVIDAPPMLGPITVAILAAAHRFIVPLQTEPQALRSLGRLVETAGQVRDRYNPGLQFDGIALTMVDSRTRLSIQVIEQVQADYPDLAFANSIPRSVRLSEMAAAGRPLVVAAPSSRGARAYAALAEEILLKHARERMIERAGDDDESDDDSDGGEPRGPDDSSDPAANPGDAPPTHRETDVHETEGIASEGMASEVIASGGGAAPGAGPAEPNSGGLVAPGAAAPGPVTAGPVVGGLSAEGLAAPAAAPPTGRVAIASGRIPERGGDIHKARRKPRAQSHVTLLAPGVSGGANGGTRAGSPQGVGASNGAGAPNGAGPPHGAGVPNGTASPNGAGTPHGASLSNGKGPASGSRAARESSRGAEGQPGQTSFLDEEAPDEWNEQNFVDLDTYMQMEAGETAGTGALAADENEWDEEWGK